MKKIVCFCFTALLGLSGSAFSSLLDYSIKGVGSGSLNGVSFSDAAFSIDMFGDTANISTNTSFSSLDPLQSAIVTISGFSPVTLNLATRLGITPRPIVFFSRSDSIGGKDLFDFYLSTPVDLSAPFGPVPGTDVFGLEQFQLVDSTGGPLSFDSSSDVAFAATGATAAIPEPEIYAMMAAGLGLMGFVGRRRKAQAAAA